MAGCEPYKRDQGSISDMSVKMKNEIRNSYDSDGYCSLW